MREGYLFRQSYFYYSGGEIMDNFRQTIGGGHYAFFSSILNSGLNENGVAAVAMDRLNSINIKLSGNSLLENNISNTHSRQMLTFQMLMKSYLEVLASTAAKLRTNEINYINSIHTQFVNADGKSTLLTNQELTALEELKSPQGVSYNNYQKLIVALNKIKYNGDIQKLRNIFTLQENNTLLLKQQLESLDSKEQKTIKTSYIQNYDQYKKQYGEQLKNAIKISEDEWLRFRRTQLQSLADKVNNVLKTIDQSKIFTELIYKAYQEHINESQFDINNIQDLYGYIVDEIIIQLTASKVSNYETFTDIIVQNVVTNIDKITRSSETGKIVSENTDNKKSIQELLAKTNANVVRMLIDAENAEEIIKKLFPAEKKRLLKAFKKIKQHGEEMTKTQYNKLIIALNKDMRETFKNSKIKITNKNNQIHETTVAAALQSEKNIQKIIEQDELQFLKLTKESLKKLKIHISKSPLAEKIASDQVASNKIINIIFNKVGGTLNLKDDVYYSIDIPNIEMKHLANSSQELTNILNNINEKISKALDSYLETYYNTTSDTKRKGETDVEIARKTYINKMRQLYYELKNFYNSLDDESQKLLDQYSSNSQKFLGSISVKEYELYLDDIGYHAGTLGATAEKAINNIQKMYELGGITTIDAQNLMFAIINCGNSLLGGQKLRQSLENYLLGGAALMVFDEGFGEAIPYLTNMEKKIQQLMPANLNLYTLNQAYIPASYVLETIHQQLLSFFSQEMTENIDNWKNKNQVIITNDATTATIIKSTDLQASFEQTAQAVESSVSIQFLFMAGMLDIFKNLKEAMLPQ